MLSLSAIFSSADSPNAFTSIAIPPAATPIPAAAIPIAASTAAILHRPIACGPVPAAPRSAIATPNGINAAVIPTTPLAISPQDISLNVSIALDIPNSATPTPAAAAPNANMPFAPLPAFLPVFSSASPCPPPIPGILLISLSAPVENSAPTAFLTTVAPKANANALIIVPLKSNFSTPSSPVSVETTKPMIPPTTLARVDSTSVATLSVEINPFTKFSTSFAVSLSIQVAKLCPTLFMIGFNLVLIKSAKLATLPVASSVLPNKPVNASIISSNTSLSVSKIPACPFTCNFCSSVSFMYCLLVIATPSSVLELSVNAFIT